MIYNTDDHVLQFCDGANWLAMGEAGDGGAGCTNPTAPEGEVIFHDDIKVMQYCEGDDWVGIGKVDACDGSPGPGTECNDGTVYAGLSPDGNVKMYAARCDQGMTWNGTACTGSQTLMNFNNGACCGNQTTTGVTNNNTGAANTAALIPLDSDGGTPGVQLHNAALTCHNLVANGYSDWYLPAAGELAILAANKAAIGNFDTSGSGGGGVGGGHYISSTETGGYDSARGNFSTNAVSGGPKDYAHAVRCVRKD